MDVFHPCIAVCCVFVWTGIGEPAVIEIRSLALSVAHPDQRGRGIGQQPETLFALAEDGFGLPFPRALPEQRRNEQCLDENQYDGRKHVPAVALPERGLTVQKDATRGQSR